MQINQIKKIKTVDYPRLLKQISDPPRTLYYICKDKEHEEGREAGSDRGLDGVLDGL